MTERSQAEWQRLYQELRIQNDILNRELNAYLTWWYAQRDPESERLRSRDSEWARALGVHVPEGCDPPRMEYVLEFIRQGLA